MDRVVILRLIFAVMVGLAGFYAWRISTRVLDNLEVQSERLKEIRSKYGRQRTNR